MSAHTLHKNRTDRESVGEREGEGRGRFFSVINIANGRSNDKLRAKKLDKAYIKHYIKQVL